MKKMVLLVFFATFSLVANADSVEIDGIYYDLYAQDKTATVMPDPELYSGDIVIPEHVMYEGATYQVKEIRYSAFWKCDCHVWERTSFPACRQPRIGCP